MVELPPVMVLTCQFTAEIGFPPESVAVQANPMPEATVKFDVCVEPVQTIALMAVAALIVIPEALAVCVVCAWAIAVMVTILSGVGTTVGAVYKPFASIFPTVELPPATLLT